MKNPTRELIEWSSLLDPEVMGEPEKILLRLPNGEIVEATRSFNLDFTCKRCSKTWQARGKTIPLKCPGCQLMYWWKEQMKYRRTSSKQS